MKRTKKQKEAPETGRRGHKKAELWLKEKKFTILETLPSGLLK